MKAVIGILSVFVLLGVVYGLAFVGIIPVQKMAGKSPALGSALAALHLVKAKKPGHPAAAPTAALDPQQTALDAQKKQLAADRAQLAKDRAAFEAQKPGGASAPDAAPASDNSAKLGAIYATMSADDLARILGKLADPDLISSLALLDEKKAGQVLAALPDDRAARLTRQMSHVSVASSAASPPPPSPHTSL